MTVRNICPGGAYMSDHPTNLTERSWLVSAGRKREPGAPLNVPLVPASNYVMGTELHYSRGGGTPSWDALEEILGGLESGRSLLFSSGMAAVAAVFDQLPQGALVVLPTDCYMDVTNIARAGAAKGYWSLRVLDMGDTAAWVSACAEADLIWLESPSNPLLMVADLEAICAAPRKPGAIVAVDNTFATPLNQQPLAFGATVSLQSATKFIGGHSDLLLGVVTTADDGVYDGLRTSRAEKGATPGALESFLAIRGVRTMAVRVREAQRSAMELAGRLEAHPLVDVVRYPGLPSHPTHEVAKRVLKGFGSMMSFDLKPLGPDGGAAFADAVCGNLRLIWYATSLGSVESTMERRAAAVGQEHLPPTLIRLSVGIEDVNDLWRDLDSAITEAASAV